MLLSSFLFFILYSLFSTVLSGDFLCSKKLRVAPRNLTFKQIGVFFHFLYIHTYIHTNVVHANQQWGSNEGRTKQEKE